MTHEYQAGVDYLDTLSAVSESDWKNFNEQIAAWEKGVESILEEEHASLQEIDHFKTIPMVEWYDEHGESQDILERLLRIRIQRLADISTQYATRAEEVRRNAMQHRARHARLPERVHLPQPFINLANWRVVGGDNGQITEAVVGRDDGV